MRFKTRFLSFEIAKAFSGWWGNVTAIGFILTFYHHDKRLRFGFYRAAQ